MSVPEQTAEQFFRPHFRGPDRVDLTPARTDPYAGRTTISSGDVTATVSTALVNSDSIITYGVELEVNSPSVNSGGFVSVVSIASGVSFAFAWATGVAVGQDTVIMWRLTYT